jgi:DNA end-binding protein Ku
MARALWSGAISFGLVNVPVKLYKATPPESGKGISFHRLHATCGTRLKSVRYCPTDDQVDVPWDEVANGYEFAKGRYAIIGKEELSEVDAGEKGAIAIEDFVDAEEVDPMLVDRSYWIVPDGPPRPYALLFQALQKTGKVAIARVVVRTRGHLAVIRPHEDHLVMSTLFYWDEVVKEDQIPAGIEKAKVQARELEMATDLIERMSTDFEPKKYKDTATAMLRKLIEEKIEAKEVTREKTVEIGKGDVVDIMDALKRSVENAAKERAQEAGATEVQSGNAKGARRGRRAVLRDSRPGRRASRRAGHGSRR